MLNHYFKTAAHNLWKYKQQNIVNIIGLAIGFVCFAISLLWIRYEATFDAFHKDSERIYRVLLTDSTEESGVSTVNPYPLSAYLQANYPEVEKACNTQTYPGSLKTMDNEKFELFEAGIDAAFLDLFDVKILEGSTQFMIPGSKEIALTTPTASLIFGSDNPIGQRVCTFGDTLTVRAIVQSWGKHSNIPFDFIRPVQPSTSWNNWSYRTYIKLRKGTDPQAFGRKVTLSEMESDGEPAPDSYSYRLPGCTICIRNGTAWSNLTMSSYLQSRGYWSFSVRYSTTSCCLSADFRFAKKNLPSVLSTELPTQVC